MLTTWSKARRPRTEHFQSRPSLLPPLCGGSWDDTLVVLRGGNVIGQVRGRLRSPLSGPTFVVVLAIVFVILLFPLRTCLCVGFCASHVQLLSAAQRAHGLSREECRRRFGTDAWTELAVPNWENLVDGSNGQTDVEKFEENRGSR